MSAFLLKNKVIDGESVLDLVHIPMRDLLKEKFRQAKEREAAFIAEHPELLQKGGSHKPKAG
jgi:hypothetical protein